MNFFFPPKQQQRSSSNHQHHHYYNHITAAHRAIQLNNEYQYLRESMRKNTNTDNGIAGENHFYMASNSILWMAPPISIKYTQTQNF